MHPLADIVAPIDAIDRNLIRFRDVARLGRKGSTILVLRRGERGAVSAAVTWIATLTCLHVTGVL